MSEFALLDMYLTFNSVDLSDHVRVGLLTAGGTQLDASAMGSDWAKVKMGLKNGSLQIEVLDDFASGSIDATLWAAYLAGASVPVALRPVNDTIATTNPEMQFDVVPLAYSLGGTLDTMAMKNLTFPIDGAVTRDTTP